MLPPLEIEIAFGHFMQSFANPLLDIFFLLVTHIGDPRLWILLAAFLYWKGEEKKSFFLATTILFTGAVIGVIKQTIERPRPSAPEFLQIGKAAGFAMPSGHAGTIASALGFYWDDKRLKARIAGVFFVLLVMLSRVYLGVHYLGDVVVGAILGFAIGRATHYLEKKVSGIKITRKVLLQEIGIVVAVIFAIVVSLIFRDLSLASILMGFFTGVFVYKLANMQSGSVSGKMLFAKEIAGFITLIAILFLGNLYNLQPELYFIGGIWISCIYPFIFDRIVGKITSK